MRRAPVPISMTPGRSCSTSWASPSSSRPSASWRPGQPPRWSSGAPGGSRRPSRACRRAASGRAVEGAGADVLVADRAEGLAVLREEPLHGLVHQRPVAPAQVERDHRGPDLAAGGHALARADVLGQAGAGGPRAAPARPADLADQAGRVPAVEDPGRLGAVRSPCRGRSRRPGGRARAAPDGWPRGRSWAGCRSRPGGSSPAGQRLARRSGRRHEGGHADHDVP